MVMEDYLAHVAWLNLKFLHQSYQLLLVNFPSIYFEGRTSAIVENTALNHCIVTLRVKQLDLNLRFCVTGAVVDKTGHVRLSVEEVQVTTEADAEGGHNGRLPASVGSDHDVEVWPRPECLVDVCHEVSYSNSYNRTSGSECLTLSQCHDV